jgi:hypothetical protein
MTVISRMRKQGVTLAQQEKVLAVTIPLDPSGQAAEQIENALQFLRKLSHTPAVAPVGLDGGN